MLIEIILEAWIALKRNLTRSFLTMLGVVMGVGVLMLVAALLTGFNQSVVETITSFVRRTTHRKQQVNSKQTC